ncbi:MAG: FAD/NAD(P)-binding protein, partial [Steroidobacteraceae bacterium]|nr:FAD/NAD(P)-binding protein [Steroidobacteraceae bacterium]
MHATQLGTSLAGAAPIDSIVIVGAGFSGTALATHLVRAARAPLDITLVEPREELGAGVAYATRDYPYPLNVAAGQMSLDSAVPDDFLTFARTPGIGAAAADYLPRQVFGDYLRERFAAAAAAAPDHV